MSPIAASALRSGAPYLAANDDDGRRFYEWGGERFWSVTTILGGGVPKYLAAWSAKLVAELVVDDLRSRGPHSRAAAALRRWERAGRAYVDEQKAAGALRSIDPAKLDALEFTLRYLKGEPDRVRDAAAARGTDVHSKAEALVLDHAREASRLVLAGAPLPAWEPEIAGHMASFVRWVDDWQPEFYAAEATVFNRPQAYAGTLDAIVRLRTDEIRREYARADLLLPPWLHDALAGREAVVVLVDYKSGNQIYPEVALQLAAYERGEFIGGADRLTELPMPLVDVSAVLHLTAKKPRFRFVRTDEEVWTKFLYAREVFRWAIETSKTVLGDPLEPAATEEVA